MKALSLNQPFAELIVTGKKTIELRKWNTKFRGTFLIHAAKKTFPEECEKFGITPSKVTVGAIVGMATLVDVKKYGSVLEWIRDQDKHLAGPDFLQSVNGFILKNPVSFFRPIPFRGKLNFFNVDFDKETQTAREWIK